MRAELLLADGCPHADEAARRFRVALDLTGHHAVDISVRIVDTASPDGCLTSPTFRINGTDLLSMETTESDGPACRWTIPTTSDLADAITPRPRRAQQG